MQKYVLKNQNGSQSLSESTKESDNILGLWKLKNVKYSSIYDIVSKMKIEKPSKNFQFISPVSYHSLLALNLTCAINNLIRKKRLEMSFRENYLIVLDYIEREKTKKCGRYSYLTGEYVTIKSLLENFENINKSIDKQLILDMIKKDLLSKYYHKVRITRKGYEYIKKNQ
jgi:hypothetical protein